MNVETATCKYLKEEIFPQFVPPPYGSIEITTLGTQKPVCLFLERKRNIMVVGKFFRYGVISLEEASFEAEKEYANLKLLREILGKMADGDNVVAPLGENNDLSALLVTERAPGLTLDFFLTQAIFEQQHIQLFEILSHLARFLVKLHEACKTGRPLTNTFPKLYLGNLLKSLREGPLDVSLETSIEKHALHWWDIEAIYSSDNETIVHGDATTTNFLFEEGNVTAIDLENMSWADRCWDLGFIAAELKHNFMWRSGDARVAEPFIGHFLWEYASYYGDANFFYVITRKIPLYMAIGLLRIARNLYLDESYRKNLILEAKRCLKYGLSSLIATVP